MFADLRIKQEPDLRIKQETDRERAEKLAERLSKRDDEAYPGRGFDAGLYRSNSDHLAGAQLGPTMVPMPAVHPPTPDQSPAAPPALAMWNTKINKASTVSTVDGGECHSLFFKSQDIVCTYAYGAIESLIRFD